MSSTVRIVGWILERCDIARFVESRANRQTVPRLSLTKPYDSVVNQRLADVLAILEPKALEFCSSDEWNAVKAEVLLAGSVEKASESSRHVLALAKARQRQFASRSEAGRYAASIRWQRSNPGGVTSVGSLMNDNINTFKALSASAPTPDEIKNMAGKVQTGSLNRLISVTDPSGEEYLINEGAHWAMRTRGSAVELRPRGVASPESAEYRATATAKTFNSAQESLDALPRSEISSRTVRPIGLVQQEVKANARGTKTDTYTRMALDSKGQTVLVDARNMSAAMRAFPNAQVVQLDAKKPIMLVEAGKVQALVMPVRVPSTPSSADFVAGATNELNSATPSM